MSIEALTADDILTKAVLVPCDSKEALHAWIDFYLGLDFPDCVVDPDSTVSPLDALWHVYDKLLHNRDPEFQREMWYAARDTGKTLAASVLEVLGILHLRRDVGHMAAQESQSINSQKYVKRAFQRPYLRDYLVSDNETKVVARWHENPFTGETLTPRQWKEGGPRAESEWLVREFSIEIVICTMRGANSLHVPLFIVDEVDIAPPEPYEEAKHIPTERDGISPFTLMISTRKSRHGIVQKELDEADESGLSVKHWNLLDFTRACPAERHRPQEPKQTLWIDDELLDYETDESFKLLPPERQDKYRKSEGFAGCATCPIFAACQGNLATRQKSKARLLKSVEYTIGKFKASQLAHAVAQLLCRKPDSGGLIYPHLDPEVHMLSPAEIAERITGDEHPAGMDKAALIQLMAEAGGKWFAGLDHGFGHYFAVVTGYRFGAYAFIVDCQAQAELELEDKIKLLQHCLVARVKPEIWPDTSDPASNKTIWKKGFNVRRKWDKGKGSVKAGIDILRSKLRPAVGEPTIFFLKGDAGVKGLVDKLGKYHWKKDAAGRLTADPEKVDDDEADAARYGVMNEFWDKARPSAGDDGEPMSEADPSSAPPPRDAPPTADNYLSRFIEQALSETGGDRDLLELDEQEPQGGNSHFYWDCS